MSAKQILIGSISGVVAGAVVGLLLAPQSGKETRQKIVDSADEWKKKLKKFKKKSLSELDHLQDVFGKQVDGLSEDVREKVLTLIQESKDSYNEFKHSLSDE
ncbi:MAG: YtxH domain-containing protein [Chitinophagaceae bacterium]